MLVASPVEPDWNFFVARLEAEGCLGVFRPRFRAACCRRGLLDRGSVVVDVPRVAQKLVKLAYCLPWATVLNAFGVVGGAGASAPNSHCDRQSRPDLCISNSQGYDRYPFQKSSLISVSKSWLLKA